MSEDARPPDAASDVPERFTVDFTGLTLLGTYRVEEKLAEGGMGSIYLGHDENLGRRVVIKVPHVKFLSEPGFRPRFARRWSCTTSRGWPTQRLRRSSGSRRGP